MTKCLKTSPVGVVEAKAKDEGAPKGPVPGKNNRVNKND